MASILNNVHSFHKTVFMIWFLDDGDAF